MTAYRITLHAHRKAGSLGLPTDQVRGIIELDDVCETKPNPTDGRIGKRLYGRVDAREFHIILVVNPGDTMHTVTTVYEVDRKDFPDGRTRRRKR